jgi:uncharacterized repeat protein (TIGR01451 family)
MAHNLKPYRTILQAVIVCLACFFATAGNARAAGTPAGSTIANTVSVSYNLGGVALTSVAGSSFVVDRVVNMTVTKNSDMSAAPNQQNVPISYHVTNTGNAAQRYALQAVSKATNTWTMNNVRIYRDTNSNNDWDAGDTPYADASTFGDIPVDGALSVMIVADTPAGVTTSQTAAYDLVATAVDAGALTASAQTAGPNNAGVDTVLNDSAGSAAGDGARDGKHSASGAYTVGVSASPVLTMTKAVAIFDQWGGNQPIPGATFRYTITATASGVANNVVVNDPLPANTVFIPNTLKLNNAALTDAADADAGDVGGTTADTVTVKLGNLTGASLMQTITFDVKIK